MSVLVCRQAPDFTAPAVLADGKIVDKFHFFNEIDGHYALLFFYPLDFTFVCPSELVALDHRIDEFHKRKTTVVGISIDSHFSHHAWRDVPVAKGGIGPVRFPLVADISHSICQSYGVEHPESAVALRGAFLIDKKKIVRAQLINDLPLGRNVNEILRLIDALQFHEQHGEVCPANWEKGKAGMKASAEGVSEYLAKHSEEL